MLIWLTCGLSGLILVLTIGTGCTLCLTGLVVVGSDGAIVTSVVLFVFPDGTTITNTVGGCLTVWTIDTAGGT